MENKEILELGRHEYADQEAAHAQLQRGMQFLLTLATALVAADLAMTRPRVFQVLPRIDAIAFCLVAAVFWYMMIFGFLWWIFRACWTQPFVIPQSFGRYLKWRDKRAVEISKMPEYDEAEAKDYATKEMIESMIGSLTDAVEVNRDVNLCRQRYQARANKWLIFAASTCVVQWAIYGVFLYRELRDGRI
jgi:hypothetical protein